MVSPLFQNFAFRSVLGYCLSISLVTLCVWECFCVSVFVWIYSERLEMIARSWKNFFSTANCCCPTAVCRELTGVVIPWSLLKIFGGTLTAGPRPNGMCLWIQQLKIIYVHALHQKSGLSSIFNFLKIFFFCDHCWIPTSASVRQVAGDSRIGLQQETGASSQFCQTGRLVSYYSPSVIYCITCNRWFYL